MIFYPPKGICKADTEGGPIVFTYVLFWVRKRILDFQLTGGFLPFWDSPNVLSPGGRLRKQHPRGPIDTLSILLLLETVLGVSICHLVICLLETLRMFYPPEGGCGSSSQGVQLILFPFYGVGNVYWTFRFRCGNPPIWKLENILSHRGGLICSLLRGPFVFNLGFIGLD